MKYSSVESQKPSSQVRVVACSVAHVKILDVESHDLKVIAQLEKPQTQDLEVQH